ncbi:MAG: PEP-CTERM sorting domain-containing protein, partial [Alphaproteobacteria bacterium]|nr:PEP-CTERM sorting domain-containing protein [Alphaproteobacteria bacterium]
GIVQLVSNVPEPSGIVLAGLGIAAIALIYRRRRNPRGHKISKPPRRDYARGVGA